MSWLVIWDTRRLLASGQPSGSTHILNGWNCKHSGLDRSTLMSQVSGTVVEIQSDNSTTISYITNREALSVQTSPRVQGLMQPTPDQYVSSTPRSGQHPFGRPFQWELLPHRMAPPLTDFQVSEASDQQFFNMFAAARTTQLPVYYWRGMDPQASRTHALTMNWDLIAVTPLVLRKQLTNLLVSVPRRLPDQWNLLRK